MKLDGPIDFARALVTAVQQLRHYGADHRSASASLDDLFITLRRHLTPEGAMRIEVAALPPENQHAAALAAHLSARSIQRLTMRSETTLSDLGTLVRLLALEPEELIAEGGLAGSLRQAGVRAIEVKEIGPASQVFDRGGPDPVRAASMTLDHLTTEAGRALPVDIGRARRAIEDLLRGIAGNPIAIWQAIGDRSHDELDAMHGVSTAVMTLAVAEALEVPDQSRIDLGVAALLHDIGLAALPLRVRVRERTAEGAQECWRHPAEGAYLLRDAENGGKVAMIVAMEHHLPALQRDGLPQSRLVGLADHVDAMTAARAPGLRRQTVETVMGSLLAGEGPRFDPVHVRLLAAVLHDAAVAGADFWS
ncbi:MAG TPA: HD domain-containing phosphohydrolase [bacterium]|nr:HD domain-containing phosphohydrolase [bacterium]